MNNKLSDDISQLKRKIRYHRKLYYQNSKPEITDSAFDAMVLELLDYKKNYPDHFLSDDPTTEVGYQVAKNYNKIQHKTIMGSLNNAHNDSDILDYLFSLVKFLSIKTDLSKQQLATDEELINFYSEPKIDGLAVSLFYIDGKLKYGATRGDGHRGEEVTKTINLINDIPKFLTNDSLKVPREIEIRGEIYLSLDAFKKLQSQTTKLRSARTAASGILRSLDLSDVSKKSLSFLAHSFGFISDDFGDLTDYKYSEIMQLIKNYGFKIPSPSHLCKNYHEMVNFYQEVTKGAQNIDYDFDGIVFKVDDIKLQKRLGFSSKYPRWAIAYKIPSPIVTTKLKDVVFQVSRHGNLSPVAILEPVNIDGVSIARASLYNLDEINRLNIALGDTVLVMRAGQTIPKVIGVKFKSAKSQKIVFPKTCPSCRTKIIRVMANFRCPNDIQCRAQRIAWMSYIASKEVFNIVGLGPSIIEKLETAKIITQPYDIYSIQAKKEQILSFDGFALKSVNSLIAEIDKTKNISFEKFILALGIEAVGISVAKILAETFRSYNNLISHFEEIYDFINHSDNSNISRLEEKVEKFITDYDGKRAVSTIKENSNNYFIDLYSKSGIGLHIIIHIINFFSITAKKHVCDTLYDCIKPKNFQKTKKSQSSLSGQKVVFTGKLSISRSEAKELAHKNDMFISSSLSTKTNLLVCGEKPGSKLKLAKELGVKILSEEEFLSHIAK